MAVIGILALQGDFAEHKRILEECGAEVRLVKHAHQLLEIDGLVIPGGESTTIGKLTSGAGDTIFDTILERAHAGMPIYGTCMGTIFLAREIEGSAQGRLALMDIKVKRNAFGPQRFSREQSVQIDALGNEPFPVVFIRGPIIVECGSQVQALAEVSEGIVMARQGSLLATAFHPELTDDKRVHRYFLSMVDEFKANPGLAGLVEGTLGRRVTAAQADVVVCHHVLTHPRHAQDKIRTFRQVACDVTQAADHNSV